MSWDFAAVAFWLNFTLLSQSPSSSFWCRKGWPAPSVSKSVANSACNWISLSPFLVTWNCRAKQRNQFISPYLHSPFHALQLCAKEWISSGLLVLQIFWSMLWLVGTSMRQSYISSILHQLLDIQFLEKKNRCNRENRSTANCESCFPECTWSHHKIHEYAWDNTLHPLLSILHPCRRVSAGDAKHLKLKRSNANTHYLSTNMNPKTNQETPWPNCCAHQQLCAKVLQDVCPDTIFDSLREARLTSQGVPAKSTMPPLNWTNSILKNVLRVDVCSITQKQCCQGSIPHGEIG